MKVVDIKLMAKENLALWAKYREESLIDLKDNPNLESIAQLFTIADELSDVSIKAMDIHHQLSPQIVGILSATILGITKGDILEEVITFVNMLNNGTSGNLH